MGGNDTPNIAESTADLLNNFAAYYGRAQEAVNKELLPTAQAQLAADTAVSPEYAKLQSNIFSQYAPQMASVGDIINAASNMAAAKSESDIAAGPGQNLVDIANQLQQRVDPEFFKSRAAIGSGIENLLGSMDPTQLSGSERAEVERSIGRSGYTNPRSALDTVKNAMTFGSALQQKQSAFGDAITKAAGALPQLKTGYTGFEVATRRALTPNAGTANFVGTQKDSGSAANQFAGNVMGQLGAANQELIRKSTSPVEAYQGMMGGIGAMLGGLAKAM